MKSFKVEVVAFERNCSNSHRHIRHIVDRYFAYCDSYDEAYNELQTLDGVPKDGIKFHRINSNRIFVANGVQYDWEAVIIDLKNNDRC